MSSFNFMSSSYPLFFRLLLNPSIVARINEEGCKYYDIYDGYPPEIKERYFNHLENIKETRNRFNKKGIKEE